MAVTTTPRELMEAAYAKSMKNDPGQLATEDVELLDFTIRTIRKFYSIAARVNPTYFADSSPVAAPGAGTPWARPEGAESIFLIEDPTPTEVILVPYNERTLEPSKPAVYRMGKNFYTCGGTNDPDPSSDQLTFWHSKRPTDPADADTAIDPDWEEDYNELLILEIALYLIVKDSGSDGRDLEFQAQKAARDEWLRLFIMFLEHETINEVRRFPLRRFQSPTAIPLTDLLIGGTTVKIGRGGN